MSAHAGSLLLYFDSVHIGRLGSCVDQDKESREAFIARVKRSFNGDVGSVPISKMTVGQYLLRTY